MACDNVQDILQLEAGRIGADIYNRAFGRSPWIRLIRRGMFPQGMGTQISVLTYERSAPTDARPTWSQVGSWLGVGECPPTTPGTPTEGGSCLPATTKVKIAQTLRNYDLRRRALEGPDFCSADIQFAFQLHDQLAAVMDVLTRYTILEWEIRDRHEYMRLVKWKVTVDAALTTSTVVDENPDTAFTGCPTSILTQGVLNTWKIKLLRDGAIESALGMENGSAILTLITDAETSDDLVFRNADIRQDLRWGRPNDLLAPFGVERSYRGFYHLLDMYPIRGNCISGTFTEVAPFYETAATKGNKAEPNPTYAAVNSMISFIFDPEVFHQLIPEPITNPAQGFSFKPVNSLGVWQLMNILDRVCNPDGTIVYHRGILAAGSKPVHPERGVAFLHKRCDPSLNLVTSCS